MCDPAFYIYKCDDGHEHCHHHFEEKKIGGDFEEKKIGGGYRVDACCKCGKSFTEADIFEQHQRQNMMRHKAEPPVPRTYE